MLCFDIHCIPLILIMNVSIERSWLAKHNIRNVFCPIIKRDVSAAFHANKHTSVFKQIVVTLKYNSVQSLILYNIRWCYRQSFSFSNETRSFCLSTFIHVRVSFRLSIHLTDTFSFVHPMKTSEQFECYSMMRLVLLWWWANSNRARTVNIPLNSEY